MANKKNNISPDKDKQYDDVYVISDGSDTLVNNINYDVKHESDNLEVEILELGSEYDVDVIDVKLEPEVFSSVDENELLATKNDSEDEETEFDNSVVFKFSKKTPSNISKTIGDNRTNSLNKLDRIKFLFKEDLIGNSVLILFLIFALLFILYLFKIFL